ncbi:MAG: hypothetical protein WC702_01455 [Patescibacteria group bacterium]
MPSLSMGLGLRHEQRLEPRLSLAQRAHQVQAHIFGLRLQLIGDLRNEQYKPKGVCPKCSRRMTPTEILRGFNNDPNDFTTACTGCGFRFDPKLKCSDQHGTWVEVPFYCNCQTLERLRGKETLRPSELVRQHAGIYRSAIVHFGNIRAAFAQIGIEYALEDFNNWENKVEVFLGRLPDTVIAECVGRPVVEVRRLRRKLGISRYTTRRALDELGE